MYIKRKVFSVYEDENGEERYFSTTEYVNEEDYLDEREFAEKENVKLGKSLRGYGRSSGIEGLIGVYSGKKAANKAAKEGKSEAEVVDAAGKRARRVTGAIGGGLAAGSAAGLGYGAVKGMKYLRKSELGSLIKEGLKEDIEKSGAKVDLGKVSKALKPGRVGAGVAGLAAGVGAVSAIKRARRAESGAHKNTIERIKNGKKDKK